MLPRPGLSPDPDLVAVEITERYAARLRVFAMRRLRDAAAADDAVQETLACVLAALRDGRVRHMEALPSYVFETARHVCQQVLRQGDRALRAHARFADVQAATTPPSTEPLRLLLDTERRQQVRTAIDNLEPRDRQLIHLTLVDGLTAEDVAARLGTTANNVRVRRHRIVRRIAAALRGSSLSDAGRGAGNE